MTVPPPIELPGQSDNTPVANDSDTISSGLTRCQFSTARDRALYPLARRRRAARQIQSQPPLPVGGCRRFRLRVGAGRRRSSWRVSPTTPRSKPHRH